MAATSEIRPVSSERILRALGNAADTVRTITWRNLRIEVRHSIDADDFVRVVRNIIGNCTMEDGFAFEFVDFSTRVNIIAAYALIELPEDFGQLFRLAYGAGLYDAIVGAVNTEQIGAIQSAVETYIKML